jgi:hypothetical protein
MAFGLSSLSVSCFGYVLDLLVFCFCCSKFNPSEFELVVINVTKGGRIEFILIISMLNFSNSSSVVPHFAEIRFLGHTT